MEYWSRPVLVGRREWRLVNVSGKQLTVEAVKSFDGVSKPFLVVEGGPHQTIPDGQGDEPAELVHWFDSVGRRRGRTSVDGSISGTFLNAPV